MNLKNLANFFHEAGTLKRMVRNSYQTLGSGGETIAEHLFRCALIGYCLAKIERANEEKVMKMCLLHDICETRTGDFNFVHSRYVRAYEKEARRDQAKGISIGEEMIELMEEFEGEKSREAQLAKDADVLEQLLQEKEYYELGNQQALLWMEYSASRLKTGLAKQLAKAIMSGSVKDWWWGLQNKPSIKDGKPKFFGKKIEE